MSPRLGRDVSGWQGLKLEYSCSRALAQRNSSSVLGDCCSRELLSTSLLEMEYPCHHLAVRQQLLCRMSGLFVRFDSVRDLVKNDRIVIKRLPVLPRSRCRVTPLQGWERVRVRLWSYLRGCLHRGTGTHLGFPARLVIK